MSKAPVLWTPGQAKDKVAVERKARRQLPKVRKKDGGSHFDDEMMTEEEVAKEYANQTEQLLMHLNARPDHSVFVGTTEERTKMREVFNYWKRVGALGHNPKIRIDYGVGEGAIRVGEDR